MAEREQIRKSPSEKPEVEVEETPAVSEKGEKLKEPKVELPKKLGEEHRIRGQKQEEAAGKKQEAKSG